MDEDNELLIFLKTNSRRYKALETLYRVIRTVYYELRKGSSCKKFSSTNTLLAYPKVKLIREEWDCRSGFKMG